MVRKRFSQDVTRFVERTGVAPDLILRKIALDAFGSVLALSPVDTGRFRANWRLTVDRIDYSVSDAPDGSPGFGADTSPSEQGKAVGALGSARWGQTIYITNNLPYALPLERGHSKQNTTGILRRGLDETLQDFRKVVRAIGQAGFSGGRT